MSKTKDKVIEALNAETEEEVYNHNNHINYEKFDGDGTYRRFNAEVAIGLQAIEYNKKYPNDQVFGREVRKLIENLKKDL